MFRVIYPLQQFAEIVPLVEPIDAPKPLTEQRQIMLGQQSDGDDALRTVHLLLPSVTQYTPSYPYCRMVTDQSVQ